VLGNTLRDAGTGLKTGIIEEENERLVAILAILGYLNSLTRISDALYELSSQGKYLFGEEEQRILEEFVPGLEGSGRSLIELDLASLHDSKEAASRRCVELKGIITSSNLHYPAADGNPAPLLFKLYHALKCTGNMLDTL